MGCCVQNDRARVTLAALDVGSGATKLDVSVVERPVDGGAGPWQLVGEPLFSEQVRGQRWLHWDVLRAAQLPNLPNPRLPVWRLSFQRGKECRSYGRRLSKN